MKKKLRAIYPNSLNERARKHNSEAPVWKLFFIIPRTKQRPANYESNNNYSKCNTNIHTNIHTIIQNYIKNFFFKICLLLNNFIKKSDSE